jgi:arsenate reductase (glutaredoxin)
MSDPLLKPAVTLFGIPNCDQCRKAKTWLNQSQVPFTFYDIRKDGLRDEIICNWLTHLPWDALLNRRGTTWRAMTESQRAAIVDQSSAVNALLANPTLLKRPILTSQQTVLVGFTPDIWANLIAGVHRP